MLAGLIVLTVAATLVVILRWGSWEPVLIGPFYGTAYPHAITSAPSSALGISDGYVLEVYPPDRGADPILALRSPQGSRTWARCLSVEITNSQGARQEGRIHAIRLLNASNDKGRFKVRMVCDWDWGGGETGVIYLSNDRSFLNFYLGW